jgi:catechol 1,2-dioxygenase
MQRRSFLKNTALSAIAISATGFIHFDGHRYIGDCETTSDILGPFYRPDSPMRSNLVIAGDKGDLVELSGKIMHQDCITPYKKAKIELWHCNGTGVYDNDSTDFKYRGTAFSDEEGNYAFQTILPVPYDVGNGTIRPAHFHLMITAEGYQPLVTQLYFTGDQYIKKDTSAGSTAAKRRILDVQTEKDGAKKVTYDVAMSETLGIEPTALDRLIGVYVSKKEEPREFFKKDNLLWMKNDLFGINMNFIGDNTFQMPGVQKERDLKYTFTIKPTGSVLLTVSSLTKKGEKESREWVKGK